MNWQRPFGFVGLILAVGLSLWTWADADVQAGVAWARVVVRASACAPAAGGTTP